MIELHRTNKLVVWQGDTGDYAPVQKTGHKGFRRVDLYLNSVTFGIANYRSWYFVIWYDPESNFNCEAPTLSTYRETVRSCIGGKVFAPDASKIVFKEDVQSILDTLPTGYTYEMLVQYHPEVGHLSMPQPFKRLAWDTPAPPIIAKAVYYVHPEEARLMYQTELVALSGNAVDYLAVPQPILEYVDRQVALYEEGLWGDQDFQASFFGHMIVEEAAGQLEKPFSYQHYTADYVPPCSRRKGFNA